MNENEIAKEMPTRRAIDPKVIHLDVAKIPLTDFMKALGQEHPVAADGDLRIYNSPYDSSAEGTMVINIQTNKWRDTKSGANGGIYDLAYELTGNANKSELNRYIAGEMDYYQKQQIAQEIPHPEIIQTAYDKFLFVVNNFSYLRNNPNEYQEFSNSVKLGTWGEYPYTFNFNGDASKLPKGDFELYENAVDTIKRFHNKADVKEADRSELKMMKSNEILAREEYETHLLDNLYKTITTIKNNINMAKKKTEEPAAEVKKEQPKKKTAQKTAKSKTASKEETSSEESKKAKASKKEDSKVEKNETVEKEAKQKRPPMLVTNSGDLVSHAHWYKTDDGKLFFTAKVNMVPLKSKPMDPADLVALQEKKTTLQNLFEKYYPTKVAPRFPDSDFDFKNKTRIYGTSEGQMVVNKYNVYKNMSPDTGYNIGQYMLYAEVKGPNMEKSMKMSVPASQDVLDNYFDHTRAPEKQIMMSFGDRLGLKEHYEQFKLPEGIEVKDSQVRLVKDKETNQYQLNVKGPDGVISAHTLSYYDTKAFFDKKVTKEQLVAKHFDKLNNIDWSVKQDNKQAQKQETQKSMGMK